jgi:chaperonin GroEL (HSP60 family)
MERKKLISNVVGKDELRRVQFSTLYDIKDRLIPTFGPRGSNTMLVKEKTFTEYTKDGHKVLKGIQYMDVIERSIQDQLVELTRHIVKTVGDGTTSAIILSSIIFEGLMEMETNISPYELIELFKEAVSNIKEKIQQQGREVTMQDIYDIAFVSTNGNKEVAANLYEIYNEHGQDVFIDVGISNTQDSIVKSYDGLTLETGYSDPAYINTKKGITSIRNAKIYAFADPIDTPEMMAFLNQILSKNIIEPYNLQKPEEVIPTVIMAPKISRDLGSMMEKIIEFLYRIDNVEMKPPLLIINDIHQYDQYSDIARLCGCKPIAKYIDPKIQEEDIKAGRAPSIDTIQDFYGFAELVEADDSKCKFINPEKMFEPDEDDYGNRKYSATYTSLLKFLETELQNAINTKDNNITGKLKRRINSLKANMVDYLIGGITVTDRDSLRDLVEDAVLNCRSACRNGVGFGANYEGLIASEHFMSSSVCNTSSDTTNGIGNIYILIYNAYVKLATILYSTAMNEEDAEKIVIDSIEHRCPYNLRTKMFDNKVLCTIDTDIVILDTISKIITIMFTANQAMVPTPMHNKYLTIE